MKNLMRVMMMALAMVLTVTAYAQPQNKGVGPKGGQAGDPATHAKAQTEKLKTALDLTPDQETKIEAINLKYAKKLQAKRQEMRKAQEAGQEGDQEAMREEMQEERKNQYNEIKAVLTPEQVKKFDTLQKEEFHGKGKKGKKGKKDGTAAKQKKTKTTE